AIRRGVDALDVLRTWAQALEHLLKAIERRMDGLAARVEPEPVARNLPARAELLEHALGPETVAHHLAQRLLDGVVLRLEAGQDQIRGPGTGESTHAARDVQRRRAGDHVRIAGREELRGRDAHGAAHLSGAHPQNTRSRSGGAKQTRKSV